MTDRAVEVAVVGAGIVGCAIAWECARRGASVLLLDRGEPGAEASSAAAGMLAPETEAADPGEFLELGMRSRAMWPEFAASVEEASGMSCGLRPSGLLRVAWDAEEADALRARFAWLRAAGSEVEWLDGPAVAEAEPAFGGTASGAAWFPGAAHVDARATIAALLAAMRTRDVEIRAGTEVARGGVAGAFRFADGELLVARIVILATGSWTARLVRPWEGITVPIRPMRGQLVSLEGVDPVPRRILYGGPLGYAVGRADGTVLVGATEEDAGFDASPSEAATEQLVAAARRLLRGAAAATGVTPRAGLRPATADGLPVMGEGERTARGSRLFVAAGHHRNGVLLAPATAAGIAGLALDGTKPAGWEPFRPGRARTVAARPAHPRKGHEGHAHD